MLATFVATLRHSQPPAREAAPRRRSCVDVGEREAALFCQLGVRCQRLGAALTTQSLTPESSDPRTDRYG